jgi:SOS-response transcriptional repressor LexA
MPHVDLAPSDHEIMAHHGVAVQVAYQHVRALQRKGLFSSAPHHRNIRLSPEHVPPAGLPIIGRVVAGAPMLTVKHLARDPELHRLWRCVEAIRPAFQGNQQGGPAD